MLNRRVNGLDQICCEYSVATLVRFFLSHSHYSLIYQLLDYGKALCGPSWSPTPSERSNLEASADEEWCRRRMLDDASDREDVEKESTEMQREAKALDKAMEYRMLARKSSSSSTGSGIGLGLAWKSRYSARKRTGSSASNMTSNSMLSEHLVEEDEEQELLGIGGGFDPSSSRPSPLDGHAPSDVSSDGEVGAVQVSLCGPPSAPPMISSFKLPPVPATPFKSTFDTSRRCASKTRRRPTPLDILPTVPDSPINAAPTPTAIVLPRSRKESRATKPTSLSLRAASQPAQPPQAPHIYKPTLQTPSQTLFVFPPSPTFSTCTPSAMTLTSNSVSVPFPSTVTPRPRSHTRRTSLIGLMMPPTPTTAHARVDARGWVGIH
jgi:tyrosine-protein phosphatase MSG5